MSIETILAERGKTHGDFATMASVTQQLKEVIHKRSVAHLNAAQMEALDMICHKIGRIISGNPGHLDHWDDIAGYAILVSKFLSGKP
jgi:hypothetical protein